MVSKVSGPNEDGPADISYCTPNERRLFEAYRDAGKPDNLRNQIVPIYLPLLRRVVKTQRRRLPKIVETGDIRGNAYLGLINGIQGYDLQRGVRPSSYLEWRIRGAILDGARTADFLPRPTREKSSRLEKMEEAFFRENGRLPTPNEVCEQFEISPEEYQSLIYARNAGTMKSLDNFNSDGDGGMLIIKDNRTRPPGKDFEAEEFVRGAIRGLSEEEIRIIALRYWSELSMREVGEVMGLSEIRVCKIHANVLERLQERF